VGETPWNVFISRTNTIFVTSRHIGSIVIWDNESTVPTRNITDNLHQPYGLFGTNNGDIYIDNGLSNYRVEKWTANATGYTTAMHVCASCQGLFIDINDNLHCTLNTMHQVIVKSLNDRMNIWKVEAGIGVAGSTPSTLRGPRGIYVDIYLSLYVADSLNNRIQKFAFGQLNGTTVVGSGPSGVVGISLASPAAITMDADGYLFICDQNKHRIVGSDRYGFRCIVACSGFTRSGPAGLSFPRSLDFDSYGNLYVVDYNNSRFQKFLLTQNSCGKVDLFRI